MTCVANDIESPKSEPALELHSRAAPSVEAHHCSDGPDVGRNSGGRQIIIIKKVVPDLTVRFIINQIEALQSKL